MTGTTVAQVAVDRATLRFDRMFDYLIPPALQGQVSPGVRVLVPFGAGNQKRQGIVLELGQVQDTSHLKPLHAVLEGGEPLSEEMFLLIRHLRDTTFCTYYEAVKTVLPAAMGYEVRRVYAAQPNFNRLALSADAAAVYEYLARQKNAVPEQKLCGQFGLAPGAPALAELTECGAVRCEELAHRRTGDETILTARMTAQPEELPEGAKLTPKQRAVAEFLWNVGAASLKEIGYFTGCTSAVVRTLEKKGLLELFENVVLRTPHTAGAARRALPKLTPEQRQAYEGISSLLHGEKPEVSLLYGVTGSGKTSVYLHLIGDVLRMGRQAIVLVPEISLTPQAIEEFTALFGARVAILHSGLSLGERLDEYKRVRDGLADIVIGTRSAIFAPCKNLGLIIIDEEQEHTYKSEKSPRFAAAEVAKFRAAYHRAQLVLGSATPSVESYYRAKSGSCRLFTLKQRYGEARLPSVYITDMAAELREGNTGSLSRELAAAIEENLRDGRQTILLLNRRGYNTLVKCASCGTVAKCPNCSISLTYHQANNRLMCHYCGHSEAPGGVCPVCGSRFVKYTGAGTQKLQDELAALFPQARVLRMDADTTMQKGAYQKSFDRFSAGEYDILLGTQMVAKGLNFPDVTLVGVLGADMTLFGDNFKSAERTFSLLTQVVGRSGRGEEPGRAYIQTSFPENDTICLAAMQDYDRFYEQEILARQVMLYPPFCRMAAVGFSGVREQEVLAGARAFLQMLKQAAAQHPDVPMRVLGPSPNLVLRASGRYRYKLVIKCRGDRAFRDLLRQAVECFLERARHVKLYVDMNFDGSF